MKMPVPLTFGDNRPTPPKMPTPAVSEPQDKPRRRLKSGCDFPPIETYRQTNGHLYLTRFRYNGVWVSGIGPDEPTAIDQAQQFYMQETAKGRQESEEIE